MRALSAAFVKRLNISRAVLEEANAQRSLVPVEPGWQAIGAAAPKVARYIENIVKTEWSAASEREIGARKAGHGVRPVAYLGPVERIVYRALATLALQSFPPLDRSPEAYLKFVKAPAAYAAELDQKNQGTPDPLSFFLFNTPVEYVVKSDITSFYQYVDHAILTDELLAHGADFEAVVALIELLGGVQGKAYGLPQLSEPSDRLSEIYIDRVERAVVRSGLAAWRYNDDFRIACNSYAEALTAIEELDAAARSVGLVISEGKTFTYGLWNYVINSLGLEVTDPSQLIAIKDDVEGVVGDYTDNFIDDDGSAAAEFLGQARVGEATDGGVDLKEATSDEVRLLRRALGALTARADPAALKLVKDLAAYVPSLTPSLARYLLAVKDADGTATYAALDSVIAEVSLSEWQKLWWLSVTKDAGALQAPDVAIANRLQSWVNECRERSRNELVRAAATYALSSLGLLSLAECIGDLQSGSAALLTYYLSACSESAAASGDPESSKRIDALAGESLLYGVITGRVAP